VNKKVLIVIVFVGHIILFEQMYGSYIMFFGGITIILGFTLKLGNSDFVKMLKRTNNFIISKASQEMI